MSSRCTRRCGRSRVEGVALASSPPLLSLTADPCLRSHSRMPLHSLHLHTILTCTCIPRPQYTCNNRYQYRRLWWAGLLGSHTTLTVLYLLLMSALIAVLGFIPVLNLLPSSKASSGDSGSGSGGGGISPSPAPGGGGGGGGGGSGSVVPQPMWVLVSLHIANGLIMMGVVGLFVSMALGILRAVGCYTGLWVLPESFCPACFWCLDLSGGPGIGWAPFVECGAAGECGIALVVILVVVMLIVGITAAAYMLYALLWALVQRGLDKAQHMVENVQQEEQGAQQAGCTGAGAAAKHSVV